MKIPFPYGLAAELYLFYPPRKLTLIHTILVLSSVFAALTIFFVGINYLNYFNAILSAIFTFLFSLILQYHVACRFLKLLLYLSHKGLIERPDDEKMKKRIEINRCK